MTTATFPRLSPAANGHVWTFFRAGGLDQVNLKTGEDLAALATLDPKLWVALSCPTRGLEFDTRSLDLMDLDHDGRIRLPEILTAVQWAVARLKQPGDLIAGNATLPLAAIRDDSDSGKLFLTSARRILQSLGRPDATGLTVVDVSDTAKIAAQAPFNGDGIVPAESAADDAARKVIAEILDTVGGKPDLGGKPGVDQAAVDLFFKQLQDYAAWWDKADAATGAADALPLGDATPEAFVLFAGVRGKIEDYFTRCRLAAFDARAAAPLNRTEADFAGFAAKDLSAAAPELASLPLARVEAARPLPLQEGLNPAWAARLAAFRDRVVVPLLGAAAGAAGLSEAGWIKIQTVLAPYEARLASKPDTRVEKLGIARIRELLGGTARQTLCDLIARDLAAAPELNAVADVERLVRYHRDLYRLLMNFVSFADFYSRDRLAIFQAGTLYLDGRSCKLCIQVDDAGKHATLASLGKLYLVYCECSRKDAPGKITIAAAFTAGDSDYLLTGRNGVFVDQQGRDWDATIIKIIENPISIRQAVWAPYKRLARMISNQVEKMAAAREKAVQDKSAAGVEGAAGKAAQPPPAAKPGAPAAAQPAPVDVGKMVGIFAAIGLALGALGTALGVIIKSFLELAWWQQPLAILAVFVLISGPSVVLAWLKLRQRTLGPVLDATGWAVNGRVAINLLLGRTLTDVAKLPPNAIRSLEDPYEDKNAARRRRLTLLLTLLVVTIAVAVWLHWETIMNVLSRTCK